MSNITGIHDCYGCGVCAFACPKQIIDIHLNGDGFYEPYIENPAKCVNCSICTSVCSFNDDRRAIDNQISYTAAGWSYDPEIRLKCSSGGVGYEIAKYLIGKGYSFIGVKYNVAEERAEHYLSETVEQISQSIGSKYIQSYTLSGFRNIDRKKKYVIVGTPCQIDSIRRYIKLFKCSDNFVLIDFFCHGVPSMILWKKYLKHIKADINDIEEVTWRNKYTGWHDSWAMCVKGKDKTLKSWLSRGDLFYKLFLGDACLGKQCYQNCKFKYERSSADIRIGDAWGTFYKDDQLGVSAVISYSEKGTDILKSSNIVLNEKPFDLIAEYQMKKNAIPIRNRALFTKALKSKYINIQLLGIFFTILKRVDMICNKILYHI